jgi:hypothetical protein
MVDQFNGMLQLQVVKITVVGSTDVERKWWDECADFKRDVLGKEWVVSEEEIKLHTREKEKLRRRGQKGGVDGKRGDEKTRKRTREKEGTTDTKRRHKKSSTEKDEKERESAGHLSIAPRPAVSSKSHPHLHPPRKPSASTSSNPPFKPPKSVSNLVSAPAIPGTTIKKRYHHLPIAAVIPENDRAKYDTLGL